MIFTTIFYNCQNNIKYVNYQKNYDNIINEIISKNNYNSTNTSYTIINQKYINIIDKTNLMPLNTLIKINNQNININDLLLKDKIEDFNNLLAKETLKKYPEFISTVILNENNRSYEITEDKITVYFSNENIIPTFNERISIDLTCSDIKNIINYNCNEVKYLEDLNQASSVPHLNKIVAITFDDGPNLKYTNEVVDILEKNKANGTFFVIGNKLTYQYKSILLNCLAKNNEIGSHTYSHKVLTKLSLDKLKNERLEKERQDKIRECRQRQIQTYNDFIKEQENIRQKYIKYENYKRQKLLEDSKKWKELCIVIEFLDHIKKHNDASDNEWLDWAYSYLNDINPTNNKYFRNYNNYEKNEDKFSPSHS